MIGRVKAVNISENKGTKKTNVYSCEITQTGLKGDSHAGDWHRQVSLLAKESIDKMKKQGLALNYGDFAENITTEGIILYKLPIGKKIKINNVVLEVTQIGKKCHHGCEIRKLVGNCIMPEEGIFAKVLKTGTITVDDKIEIINNG